MARPRPTAPAPARPPYRLHPGLAMEEKSLANLAERTGRTLDEWVAIVEATGPPGREARAGWLKAEHGFTTQYAAWVAGRASGDLGAAGYDPEAYVEALFSGPKAALRPILARLLDIARGLGDDVGISPCQTFVPVYRDHVIAQIKPTTRTRIDLGLALGDSPAVGRLIDTGGLARRDRITRRVAISRLDEVDDEVASLLRRAYERDETPPRR